MVNRSTCETGQVTETGDATQDAESGIQSEPAPASKTHGGNVKMGAQVSLLALKLLFLTQLRPCGDPEFLWSCGVSLADHLRANWILNRLSHLLGASAEANKHIREESGASSGKASWTLVLGIRRRQCYRACLRIHPLPPLHNAIICLA